LPVLPRPFLNFAQIEILGMPSLFFVWLVVIVLSIVITTLTRFGRNVFAIGSNPEACPTQWHQHPLHHLRSVCVLGAGLFHCWNPVYFTLGKRDPDRRKRLRVGCYRRRGSRRCQPDGRRRNDPRDGPGALLIATLRNGGNLLGINPFILQIAIGGLIVASVLIDQLSKRQNA
jgi:hypothetical protein